MISAKQSFVDCKDYASFIGYISTIYFCNKAK